MPSKQLEILFEARDNATAAIKKLNESLDRLSGTSQKTQQSFMGLVKGAAGAYVVTALTNAVRDGADAWLEYEKGTKKAHEAIFGLVKALPIIGSFAAAGESLGKAFAESDLRKLGLGEIDIARRQQSIKDEDSAFEAQRKATADLNKLGGAFLSSPEKARFDAKQRQQDTLLLAEQLQAKAQDAIGKARGEEMERLKRLGYSEGEAYQKAKGIDSTAESKALMAASNSKRLEAEKQYKADIFKVNEDSNKQLAAQVRAFEDEMEALQTTAAQKRLARLNDVLGAELEAIRYAHDKAIDDATAKARQQLEEGIIPRAEVDRQFKARKDAIDAQRKQDEDEAKRREEDRHSEDELNQWRSAAQARKDAEDALMNPERLAYEQEKQKWLRIAADDRLDEKTRRAALQKANVPFYQERVAPPLARSRFLTGLNESYSESHNNKNYEKLNQITKNTEHAATAADKLLTFFKEGNFFLMKAADINR